MNNADRINSIEISEGVVIGLDIGGTTTKIVGFKNGKLLTEKLVQASDPVASAYGALGKFLRENCLKLAEVEEIRTTGVGSSAINGNLFDCPTRKVPEFNATGLGGLYVAGLERAVVVSMGTGTSIVYADQETTRHIIGSGVGGGTLLGLADRMLQVRDFATVAEMADHGSLENVDLTIGDISREAIGGLSANTTASNFGKVNDKARPDDLALGIVNLVFQSVGTASVLSARLAGVDQVVFTGNMVRVTQGRDTLKAFSVLYGIEMIVPERAEFATAIGAALHQREE
ncbi:MAG: type II pantothenate kinase [Eubacteriales bacterium]|nr:type II pantothenate kinase [Eubacteriales bacterium]MDD4541027.1 type II pantothenate kinase [Eubacteriales bacterium]